MLLPFTGDKKSYEGGELKVDKLNISDFHLTEFQRYVNCCAFFTGCNYEWEPIKSGCMAVLDFDIVWRPSPTSVISSINLPSFLAATKEIKEILSSWNYPPLKQRKKDEMLSENVDAANFSVKHSVAGPSHKILGNAFPSEDTHILVFPLDKTYYQTNFQFSTLCDKDRQIAQILQSIDLVDVHLATVVHIPSADGTSICPKISQWINSEHSIPQFKNYLLISSNDPPQIIMTSNLLIDDDDNSTEMCPVIVIQPRHQSIRRCCHFQFDAALTYLESRLTSGANWEKMRLHLLTCLGCVLQFCQENPLKVWDVPEPRATERTLRLLKICHRLNAEIEILFLIEILGQDFNGSGVRNQLVARSIVDLFWNMQRGNYFI